MWDFIVDRRAQLLTNAYQHVYLVVLAVLVATLIAVVLAVLVTRLPEPRAGRQRRDARSG